MSVRMRKKPVIVEACRWTGDNFGEVREFVSQPIELPDPPVVQDVDEFVQMLDEVEQTIEVYDYLHTSWVKVFLGQWVVRGVKHELYPLDDEVRQETYDILDDG